MAKVRGTSTAPLVLGVIGGVLGLPAAVCSGACAAGLSSLGTTSQDAVNAAGNAFMAMGLIGAVLAIIFSCFAKKNPYLAGGMLIVSTILNALTLITFNFLSLIVVVLLLIAAILCFTQKKETVE